MLRMRFGALVRAVLAAAMAATAGTASAAGVVAASSAAVNAAPPTPPAPSLPPWIKPRPKHHKPNGWCRSNECAGKVAGARNDCSGRMACKSFTKSTCERGGMGSWQTIPKPKI
jgi:hypothetical protein